MNINNLFILGWGGGCIPVQYISIWGQGHDLFQFEGDESEKVSAFPFPHVSFLGQSLDVTVHHTTDLFYNWLSCEECLTVLHQMSPPSSLIIISNCTSILSAFSVWLLSQNLLLFSSKER